MEHLVIGLCGGTGSGKTTLAKKIEEAVGEDCVLISMDSYYKDNRGMTFEERTKINYDHPNAFDMDLVAEHLGKLRRGESILCPSYDFSTHLRRDEWVAIESKKIIIIEGILLFCHPAIVEQLDIKIFIDTDADVRILRRVLRDVRDRGRSLESVITQYLTTVKPMHESFIEPYKRIADVIVPEGGQNTVAYRMILSLISQKLVEEPAGVC